MKIANRINKIPPYPFVQISRTIAQKKSEGIDVISFGIGDPDIPTPDTVIESLTKWSLKNINHRYPESEGLPEFRLGVANWYSKRFGIELNPDNEIISLIGAKEGIGHISLALLNPDDIALIPDPGYPVYSIGTLFAAGQDYIMPLLKKNNWLPDLTEIPEEIARKAKVMWLNYPNNPTGAIVQDSYLNDVVEFAKKYDITILHDACYTEIYYDNYLPKSFLNIPGAKDVGIEFHSLSKSYNMTGWRIGMAVGNSEIIKALEIVKSNLDSGAPQAIQEMALAALSLDQEYIETRNAIYENRRNKIVETLNNIGLYVDPPKASLYIWAEVPEGYSSKDFSEQLLEECNVLVSPGTSYGKYGEGFVRLSLTLSDDKIDEALTRIAKWKQ